MNTFTHKGYGRIYVDKKENIERVKEIIKEIDYYEFDYLPENLITTFDQYPKVVYVHKFSDIDTDLLTIACWKKGVKIFAFDAKHCEFPDYGIES